MGFGFKVFIILLIISVVIPCTLGVLGLKQLVLEGYKYEVGDYVYFQPYTYEISEKKEAVVLSSYTQRAHLFKGAGPGTYKTYKLFLIKDREVYGDDPWEAFAIESRLEYVNLKEGN